MSRFDISRLRKAKGMSQRELAQELQINQSFLSAIENGKSPLPIEKEERLCEIFDIENLSDFKVKRKENAVAENLNDLTDSDLFNQLLNRFHRQAHSAEDHLHHEEHHQHTKQLEEKLESLFERNERLMERNDRLSSENDRLREEIDNYRREIEKLRTEIYNLKH